MKQIKSWMWAVGGVVGLAVIMFLSDRPVTTRDGATLPRSEAEYIALNTESSKLVLDIFAKGDTGDVITKEDEEKLKQAILKFDAMKSYEPRQVAAHFGTAKCQMLLKNYGDAFDKFQQAFENRNVDPNAKEEAVRLTAIEAATLASECAIELGAASLAAAASAEQSGNPTGAAEERKRAQTYYTRAYSLADTAIQAVPGAPRYLAARGQAALALKQVDQAKKDLAAAKKLDPENYHVKLLSGLLD